jgi:catechol 2,3-dioxygenase-like lactoylglutathione lyase family enzyme
MLNHITLRVSNLEQSKTFYKAALAPLGYKLLKEKATSAGFGIEDVNGMRDFWIHEGGMAKDGQSFSCLAFTAESKEAVEQFHKAGLTAGGTDNGAPGYRENYHPNYYTAFVRDLDGYNIEAVFDRPLRQSVRETR